MDAELFLNTLYHDKPESDRILIWEKRKDKKVSYWFDHISDAIKHFKAQGSKQDTYVGCGTSAKTLPAFRRCLADEISGIPAAWIDVDILDPVHSKPNLPENALKAKEIIEPFPLKPTIIVHSGHGYQFWWVFDKFGKINNEHQRDLAADLLHRFTWTMRDCARSMGYDLDMTFDLSRVFRIPGGKNFKDESAPIPVTMEYCGSNYYSIAEFQTALDQFRLNLGEDATPIGERKKTAVPTTCPVQGKKFVIDPNAEPPQVKFDALLELDTKFRASWEHRRKDFKSGDESASTYDLSLASFAFAAEWEEQEIVNMLIAFRRVNGLPAKLVEKYYERTLITASNAIKDKKIIDDLNDIVSDLDAAENKPPEEKAALIDSAKELLKKLLKIKFIRLVEYNMDPKEYRVEMASGEIHLGGIQNLFDQLCFRRKIAEAIHVYIDKMKEETWGKVVRALFHIIEKEDVSDETNNKGQIRIWMTKFLTDHAPLYDMTEGVRSDRPFYHSNYFYFSGSEFRNYVAKFCQEIINPKAMGIMLKESGYRSVHRSVKNEQGKYITRSLWEIEISKNIVAQEFVNFEALREANRQLIAIVDDSEEKDEREAIQAEAIGAILH
jgi:hypothetical protein